MIFIGQNILILIQFRTRNSSEDMFHHDPYTGEQEYYEDVKVLSIKSYES